MTGLEMMAVAMTDPRIAAQARYHEIELAWAAGFFDGEGCVAYRERPRSDKGNRLERRLTVSIGQKHREVLDRFAQAVTEGKVYAYPKRAKNRYAYRCSGEAAVRVLKDLLPYLSEIKIRKAEQALQQYHDRAGDHDKGDD
jgi:hypothetical protein